MPYKPLEKRLPNFFRYVNKVYGFSETINSMQDKRARTEVSPQTIFMSVFLCLLLRQGSLSQLESEVKRGGVRKFLTKVDKETFCANTIANGLENTGTDVLERELTIVPKKLRRNKAYGEASHPRTIGGLKIVAIDGTESFRSETIHCPECMERHVKTKEGTKTQYVHNIVLMQIVGRTHSSAVLAILGAEPVLKKDVQEGGEPAGHEGEGVAARRLILKMIKLYGNSFFEVITADAYYTNEPYVCFVHSLSKYLVSRVKDERTTLYQEIEALSALVTPIHIDDREEQVEYWIREVPDLQESLGWSVPIRGFKQVEKDYKLVSGEKVYTQERVFHCMATLPKDKADAYTVGQIVHVGDREQWNKRHERQLVHGA